MEIAGDKFFYRPLRPYALHDTQPTVSDYLMEREGKGKGAYTWYSASS